LKILDKNVLNKIKDICGVIFDLDGTLLDTLEDIGDSVNSVLRKEGLPTHPIEKYKYLVGDGMEMLVERALPDKYAVNKEVFDKFVIDMRNEYNKCWNNKTKPYPGIPELLDFVEQLKLKKAVLSNKPDKFTKLTVQYFLDNWKFDVIRGAQDNLPKKPDPVQAKEIADIIKCKTENLLFVGDTLVDMKTAVAAGMIPIGVTWGFRTEDELIENGAVIILHKPEEIKRIFN
jgi:phosphoglycolate phosphatase